MRNAVVAGATYGVRHPFDGAGGIATVVDPGSSHEADLQRLDQPRDPGWTDDVGPTTPGQHAPGQHAPGEHTPLVLGAEDSSGGASTGQILVMFAIFLIGMLGLATDVGYMRAGRRATQGRPTPRRLHRERRRHGRLVLLLRGCGRRPPYPVAPFPQSPKG